MGHAATEFGGPVGTAFMCVFLPGVCYFLLAACNGEGGCVAWADPLGSVKWSSLALPLASGPVFSLEACQVVMGWLALCVGLHVILPGKRLEGVQLPDGSRLTYKLNAMSVFVAIGVLTAAGVHTSTVDLTWVPRNFTALLTAATAFAFAMSALLYAGSFVGSRLLAQHGTSGWPTYDFFMGRELNPRVGALDLKEFCELTPGLIGWLMLDVCFAYTEYKQTGALSWAMACVTVFHGVYVADALWFERAILTTMDITTDGFGFMLAFGDLVWVPFTYSLQARYLLERPQALSAPFLAVICAIKVSGYWIFRGSNSQKDQFRRDPTHPSVAHLKVMPTERGTRLIISGWWGVARHINYFGDWFMSWSWCLPCGFDHVLPYFYVIYFGALLVHRNARDDANCRAKYGKDWDKYCAAVPYALIPGLF